MTIRVLGLCGSLREGSYNAALLRVAQRVQPDGMSIEPFDLRPLPFYDGDLEDAHGYPEPVKALRAAVAAADAVLIATPEYNGSVTPVLKNAVDWVSRGDDSPWPGKPAAMMGAGGMGGTAMSQLHLRQIMNRLDVHFLNRPPVQVRVPMFKGDLAAFEADEGNAKQVRGLLEALAAWTRRLSGKG
jgi:chromate reductase